MKKAILLLVIVAVMTTVWWKTTPPHVVSSGVEAQSMVEIHHETPEEILAQDQEKITRNLNPRDVAGDEWKQINDYSISPKNLITKSNAASFFKTAQANAPGIYSCLKKDFCGMETRGEDDAYFDDQKTPAHILLNRNLKIMKESLYADPSLRSAVNWELLQELAASGAEMLSVEALDIIREFDSESVKTDELIKMTNVLKGSAKAEALVRLSQKNSPNDKLLLANKVAEVFAMDDANSAISVLEKLKKMNLNKTQLAQTLSPLCRFKSEAEISHNWPMVKYEANKINPDFEKNCQ